MLITRGPGDLAPVEVESNFESPREMEIKASEILLGYILEIGSIFGKLKPQTAKGMPENYTIRCVNARDISAVLKKESWDPTDKCIVEGIDDDYQLNTKVFNLKRKEGILCRQDLFPKDNPSAPHYYLIDEDQFFQNFGDRLLQEIFEPGKRPELSQLALSSRDQLIKPEDLPVRKMTPEEQRLVVATALLGQVSVRHVSRLLALYQEIAYPHGNGMQDWGPVARSNNPLHALHSTIQGGSIFDQVELRSGTENYIHAKQRFETQRYHPDLNRDGLLQTRLDMGASISIGRMRFAFNEDIGMVIAYGQRASDYFVEEGIQAEDE